jgi:hypothetical protein
MDVMSALPYRRADFARLLRSPFLAFHALHRVTRADILD